jgi:hypothetical protein
VPSSDAHARVVGCVQVLLRSPEIHLDTECTLRMWHVVLGGTPLAFAIQAGNFDIAALIQEEVP